MYPEPKIVMTEEEYEKYLFGKCAENDNIPTEIPVKTTIGKTLLGLLCPQLTYAVDHDAIPLLQGYAQDVCPVDCGKYWSREHIEIMLDRGPHRPANRKNAVQKLRQETEDKVKHKYVIIVKWGDIKN